MVRMIGANSRRHQFLIFSASFYRERTLVFFFFIFFSLLLFTPQGITEVGNERHHRHNHPEHLTKLVPDLDRHVVTAMRKIPRRFCKCRLGATVYVKPFFRFHFFPSLPNWENISQYSGGMCSISLRVPTERTFITSEPIADLEAAFC